MAHTPDLAFAETEGETPSSSWSDAAQEQPDGYLEKGTRVTILDAEGLAWFAAQVNSGNSFAGSYVTLLSDIDLEGRSWTPIGNGNRIFRGSAFSGTFDGMGHTIAGLSVSANSAYGCYGLFGIVKDGTVKNLRLEKGSVSNAPGDAAAIVALLSGSRCVVSRCSVGDGFSVSGKDVAGVVCRAYAEDNVVEDCSSGATLSGTGKAGGVVNLNDTGSAISITNCDNSGSVTGQYSGGVLAYGNANALVTSCKNTGAITSSSSEASNDDAGGIVGFATGDDSWIEDCSNSGTVTAKGNAGGIVGIITMSYSVVRCENDAEVISTATNAGGISGSNAGGRLSACRNVGDVKGVQAGGVAGETQAKSTLEECAGGAADVSGSFAGRVIGAVRTGSTSPISGGNDAHLYLDDKNGDSYEHGERSVGIVSPNTAFTATATSMASGLSA